MRDKNDIVLSLENVSLTIPIFCKTELSLKKSFYRAVSGSKVSSKNNLSSVQALNSLNLDIYRGDKIALIGHNGSGKSTFIRLVSNIYSPTSGRIHKKVKPYPMLAPSFIVPDVLTGRDAAKAHYLFRYRNLRGFDDYLNEIIDFSGLGDFISLPIRTYSAGMQNRLIFSILTFDKHEFLAIDEGFGSGDIDFYDKAQARLKEFISNSGTLIFASHSNEILYKFCTRGLVFSCGSIVYDGSLEDALNFYAKSNK